MERAANRPTEQRADPLRKKLTFPFLRYAKVRISLLRPTPDGRLFLSARRAY